MNTTRRMTRDMNTKFVEILNQLLKPGGSLAHCLVQLFVVYRIQPRLVKAQLTTHRLHLRKTRNSNTPPKPVMSVVLPLSRSTHDLFTSWRVTSPPQNQSLKCMRFQGGGKRAYPLILASLPPPVRVPVSPRGGCG